MSRHREKLGQQPPVRKQKLAALDICLTGREGGVLVDFTGSA